MHCLVCTRLICEIQSTLTSSVSASLSGVTLNAVEAIFALLCDCAAKNPDPGQSADEEDGDFFYDEDEVCYSPFSVENTTETKRILQALRITRTVS